MARTNKKTASVDNTTGAVVNEAKVVNAVAESIAQKEVLTNDTMVPCVSMVKLGKLYYKSNTTIGYDVMWENFGDVHEIEFRELTIMKSSQLMFFKENWISIPDSFPLKEEVLNRLHVKQYYKSEIDPYNMALLFDMSVSAMTEKIKEMPHSLVDSFMRYAKESVDNGTLDSISKIRAIENVLNVKLI